MNFNSQICTTKEQSERLLALGLKKETADMCINPKRELVYSFSYSEALTLYDNYGLGKIMEIDLSLPSWSLHRLIALCPETLPPDEERSRSFGCAKEYELFISHTSSQYLADNAMYGGERLSHFWEYGNLYDALISCIEWLIKEGHFNKEYLEE